MRIPIEPLLSSTSKLALLAELDLGALDGRVHLLWVIVLLLGLGVRAARLRSQALRTFGLPPAPEVTARRRTRLLLNLLALTAVLFSLLQPRTDPVRRSVQTRVRNLAICLDVSRSMLADDLKPSRLERAKLELSRLADALEGDQVGLVVFAGDAVILCPMTKSYSYFKRQLRNVTHESASQGGTRIGDALRKALSDLCGLDLTGSVEADEDERADQTDKATPTRAGRGPEELARYTDVLLITDGEDHDSFPVYAARSAQALGVGLYIVGLGSEGGHTIPVEKDGRRELVTHDGAPVRSRMDPKVLLAMVETAGRGRFLPVGTHNFDLVEFYESTIRSDEGRKVEAEQLDWNELHQPFTLLALGLFAFAQCLPLVPRPQAGKEEWGEDLHG
jgi:Ca-activated chloride channel family protein